MLNPVLMLNFNHLYYFFIFVNEKSMTRAAKKLYISQPALSTQLRHFESSMNEKLFVKSGRNLALTDQGKVVFGFARQIFSMADEMKDSLKAARGAVQSLRLRIGVSRQVSGGFAASLTTFIRREAASQSCQITMSFGTHAELVELLRAKALDAVLSNQPEYSEGLLALHEARLPVLLLASPEFQLPGRNRQLLERNPLGFLKLFELGFAMPAPSHRLRVETELFFEQLKTSPRILFEADDVATVMAAVEERLGLAFLPSEYAADRLKCGRLRAYGPRKGFWRHSIWLIGATNGGQEIAPATAKLIRSLERLNRNTARQSS